MVLLIPLFIIGPVIVDMVKSFKNIIWLFTIIFICIFPILIDCLKLNTNIHSAILNTYTNNTFYTVLFSILLAGYVDFCFSDLKKPNGIHILVWIFLIIIIYIGLCDLPESIDKITFYYILTTYVSLLTFYLKIQADKTPITLKSE